MDQFTNAERATDWRGNNIAETIFDQMSREAHPIPHWIAVGAGTGGTASTIGRFIRYRGYRTRLCVVDPQYSVTFDYFRTGDTTMRLDRGSGVEGIGRPRVEPSFVRTVVSSRNSRAPAMKMRYEITLEDPDVLVGLWVMPPQRLRLNAAPDAGLVPERAYCEVYEQGNITNQLRH